MLQFDFCIHFPSSISAYLSNTSKADKDTGCETIVQSIRQMHKCLYNPLSTVFLQICSKGSK